MSDPAILVHPRKLYAMLCACTSSATRAKAVLDFLCRATGAAGGFLFLWRDGGIVFSAAAPDGEPPPGLVPEALRVWSEHPQTTGSDNVTVDMDGHMKNLTPDQPLSPWTTDSGVVFLHRMLTVHRDAHWVPVGIAMLQLGAAQYLATLRRAHVEALCNALLDSNDVQVLETLPQPA